VNNPSQPEKQSTVDIHTATIFECARHESSIFYQRQVDDVIVVNSTIKQPSALPPQEVETRSNRNKDVTSSSQLSNSDPSHKRLCDAAFAIAKNKVI